MYPLLFLLCMAASDDLSKLQDLNLQDLQHLRIGP